MMITKNKVSPIRNVIELTLLFKLTLSRGADFTS
jgi:hypothetical protein